MKIKGTCNHQDHAGVGAALPDRLQWYRLAVLKDMGGNAVRTSHNMPTPEWVEACDRMGMMMMCETRMMSSNPEGTAQLETMIKRYRNSPSIILWSMGNEEWTMMYQPQGIRVIDAMIQRTHELDPTRLCSAAVNTAFDTHFPEQLDVMGYNYNLKVHDEWHKKHPTKPSVGSETASTVSTRGIYSTDKLRNWVSAYDLNHTDWSQLAEEWWKFYAAREWLSGGFAWTGFDYRGEPVPRRCHFPLSSQRGSDRHYHMAAPRRRRFRRRDSWSATSVLYSRAIVPTEPARYTWAILPLRSAGCTTRCGRRRLARLPPSGQV